MIYWKIRRSRGIRASASPVISRIGKRSDWKRSKESPGFFSRSIIPQNFHCPAIREDRNRLVSRKREKLSNDTRNLAYFRSAEQQRAKANIYDIKAPYRAVQTSVRPTHLKIGLNETLISRGSGPTVKLSYRERRLVSSETIARFSLVRRKDTGEYFESKPRPDRGKRARVLELFTRINNERVYNARKTTLWVNRGAREK